MPAKRLPPTPRPRAGDDADAEVAPRQLATGGTTSAPTTADEIQALSGDPNFMTSLARGLAVIRGVSQQKRQLSIAQVSHRTGIPRAAVRRCLYTLGQARLRGERGRPSFALRPQILSLGHAYLSSVAARVRVTADPGPVSATSIHESCSIAILDGDEILYVARSSASTGSCRSTSALGSRLPAHCTSMGRVLLAGHVGRRSRRVPAAREARAVHAAHADVAKERLAEVDRHRGTAAATRSSTRSSRSVCARSPCR